MSDRSLNSDFIISKSCSQTLGYKQDISNLDKYSGQKSVMGKVIAAFFFVILYVGMLCLHVCICPTCVPDAHKGQKSVSDSSNWSYTLL